VLIDWFTVGAQVLNFLILVWLLKRFLYQPVLDAIDGRERRIQVEAKAAADKQIEAQAQLDNFKNKNKAFDEQRAAMVADIIGQTSSQRERLLGEARKEADGLRAQYANSIRNDRAQMGRQITRLVGNEVFGIARKALADLAGAGLEERMAEEFVRRLRALNAEAKKSLAAAVASSSEPALLRSSFDLPAQDRMSIQNALNETLAAEVLLRFVTAPDSVCGIELRANGQFLAWSIADYLDTLQRKACALLDAEIVPPPGTTAPVRVPALTTVPVRDPAPVAAPVPDPAASAAP
jgi:F-type H+-transporting ATPase subunit b